MDGPVPTTRVFASRDPCVCKTWMLATRDGHDALATSADDRPASQRFIESPAPDFVIAPFMLPALPTRRRATTAPPLW
jgi:hypothetical protein